MPIGEGAACFSEPGGCGYASLNVGVMSFTGAPCAGTDVVEDEAFQSFGGPLATLDQEVDWAGDRPLGAVFTK